MVVNTCTPSLPRPQPPRLPGRVSPELRTCPAAGQTSRGAGLSGDKDLQAQMGVAHTATQCSPGARCPQPGRHRGQPGRGGMAGLGGGSKAGSWLCASTLLPTQPPPRPQGPGPNVEADSVPKTHGPCVTGLCHLTSMVPAAVSAEQKPPPGAVVCGHKRGSSPRGVGVCGAAAASAPPAGCRSSKQSRPCTAVHGLIPCL